MSYLSIVDHLDPHKIRFYGQVNELCLEKEMSPSTTNLPPPLPPAAIPDTRPPIEFGESCPRRSWTSSHLQVQKVEHSWYSTSPNNSYPHNLFPRACAALLLSPDGATPNVKSDIPQWHSFSVSRKKIAVMTLVNPDEQKNQQVAGAPNTAIKVKTPKRILHFSDGVLEEYSDDEVDNTPQEEQAVVDPVSLRLACRWRP